MKNSTTSPLHYKSGKIEVITILRKKMTAEQFKGFCIGNVLKYVMRAEYKNGVEDYKKAIQYLKWLIQEEEANANSEHISD